MIGVPAAALTAPVAAIVAVVIGMPLFGLLIRRRFRAVLIYVLAGLVMSVPTVVFLSVIHFHYAFLVADDFAFAVSLICIEGPIAGWAFWWAAVRNRNVA